MNDTRIGSRRPLVDTNTSATTPERAAQNGPANAATDAQESSWLNEQAGKLEKRVRAEVREQVAAQHTIGTSRTFKREGGMTMVVGAHLKEELALKDTPTFTALVTKHGPRRRASEADPSIVFAKVSTPIDGAINASAGPVSFGFSGQVEATAILGHTMKDGSLVERGTNAVRAGADHVAMLIIPSTAAELRALNAKEPLVPGSYWSVRESATAKVSAGFGQAESLAVDHATVTAAVGTSIGAKAGAAQAKEITYLGDNLYCVEITGEKQAEVSASVAARVTTNVTSGIDGRVGALVDREANALERQVNSGVSVSAKAGITREVTSQAVLDLSTLADQKNFDEFMRLSPNEAADYVKRNRLTATAETTRKYASLNANANLGTHQMLNVGHSSSKTTSTVTARGETTDLAEATFSRHVKGLLPRVVMGAERSFVIRGTTVELPNGETTAGVEMKLTRDEVEVSKAEALQADRFAKLLGHPIDGLPLSGEPKGGYVAAMALTEGDIEKLNTYSREELIQAFSQASADVEQRPGMAAAWMEPNGTVKANAKRIMDDYRSMMGAGARVYSTAESEYEAKHGATLLRDMETWQRLNTLVDEMVDARGKPANKWGDVLANIGMMSSDDQRASMLALRRLTAREGHAGGIVTALSLTLGGKSFTSKPEGIAPPDLATELSRRMFDPAK